MSAANQGKEKRPKDPVDEKERLQDAALVVFKAGLNLIPLVGGSLASLVDFVPTQTLKNIEKTVGFLSERLSHLEAEARIDVDAVDKEEFSELFNSCRRTAERTHQDEKL